MIVRVALPRRRLAALAMAWVVGGAALSAGLVAAATRPGIWIDQPLPGATLALGPTPVTVHVASPGGVDRVRFLVDGLPADEIDASPGDLVAVAWSWTPASLGEHLLTAIAVGIDGVPSVPASVSVTFVPRDQLPPQPTEPPASPTAGPTLGPGQTLGPTPGATKGPGATRAPTPVPGATRTPTPTAAPTKAATPAPTYCSPPVAILDLPVDYDQLDYPSEAQPLFEWHYSGGTGCIASQVFNVYNQVLGFDLTVDLGPGVRSYQQRSDFLWDENNPDKWCAHYHWSVTALNADGDGEPSASGSFDICEIYPDA